ncbi:hypothetical protein [Burkholderia cenocepacia]|uniref:Uncharacterized protein n=1 Tax=Burkholderia cenocepacia TaxID=95486 RepID=A0ABD4UDD2_9BURK|nr:hypothetical protein [Burkholderia cenocepacia]MCW3498692.1 hypothetical protein [Burkholderia cenocepacia]MCW3506220.1 hypothetical protein [Burkholderia cenocepacia]MCW3513845.1 hypothetical protein [Burkholderia cenocepacia]MCW3528995.1 hypothetical protein [Burkholderia cenocepacia]MCW3544671.1 hypothetical protein [Burkholderia cenocepacia]
MNVIYREKPTTKHREVFEAIEILKEQNQEITVQAVHELTNISKPTIYNCSYMRQYLRRYKSKPTLVTYRPPEQIDIENTIDAYAQFIDDQYFGSADNIKEVQQDFMTRNATFDPHTFSQAINKLVRDGVLVQHTSNPEILLRSRVEEPKSADSSPQAPVAMEPAENAENRAIVALLVVDDKETVQVREGELENTISTLLTLNPDAVLKIYELTEIVRTERKIVRSKM